MSRIVLLPDYSTFRKTSLSVFWCLASLSLARGRNVATNASTIARLLGIQERSARQAIAQAYEEGLVDKVDVDGVSEDKLVTLSKTGVESLLELYDTLDKKHLWIQQTQS